MKTLIAIVSVLTLVFTAQTRAADPNATLTKVSIRFDTHNDNKDHDTSVSVWVKNKATMFLSQDLAELLDFAGNQEFDDPSTNTFDLVLKSDKITVKDLTLPFVTITMTPHGGRGHDRWIFNYMVTLTFSDGTEFSSHEDGIVLDQDNRTHTGVFSQ